MSHGVDTKGIGTETYGLFNEQEQALVAFGMLPHDKMKILEDELKRGLALSYGKKFLYMTEEEIVKDENLLDLLKESIKKEILRELMHEITVAIFAAASAAGKMGV